MPAPVVTNINKTFSGTDGTVFTTPSITLPANSRIMLVTMGNRSAGASALPTIGGTAVMTWTSLSSDAYNPIAVPLSRIGMWTAISLVDVIGTVTVTYAAIQDAGWIIVDGVTAAPNVKQSSPGANRLDATTAISAGSFTIFGLASILYTPTFVSVSEGVAPNSGETAAAEQQGGITLEAGTVQTESRANVGSCSSAFAIANAAAFGVVLGGSEDNDFGSGALLNAERGAL